MRGGGQNLRFLAKKVSVSQGGATELSLCDPDREFDICVLTWREHPNFQLNY